MPRRIDHPNAAARALSLVAALWAAAAVLTPAEAGAAACCASSAVSGIGRLNTWERASLGTNTSWAHSTGRWDQDGRFAAFPQGYREAEWRSELWGQLRVAENWQLFARAPWVVGIREAEGLGRHTGAGLGDVQLGGRWDVLPLGEIRGWPAVALTALVALPTSRPAELATDELGADATGRGGATVGAGVQIEKARMPWFARLDLGVSVPLPYERPDSGLEVRYGPLLQGGLLFGRELLPDKLVLALQLTAEAERSMTQDGQVTPGTDASNAVATLALSWRMTSDWTWMANASSDRLGEWLGAHNRPERWMASVGLRRGFSE